VISPDLNEIGECECLLIATNLLKPDFLPSKILFDLGARSAELEDCREGGQSRMVRLIALANSCVRHQATTGSSAHPSPRNKNGGAEPAQREEFGPHLFHDMTKAKAI